MQDWPIIIDRKMTLSDYLLRCLKKGKGEEQVLAAKCLSLLCVQMGLEAEDLFTEIQPHLLTAMNDNSVALKARSQVREREEREREEGMNDNTVWS